MTVTTIALEQSAEDRVSNVLKWVLFAIAVCTFALLGWATDVTYQTAPPQPERFLAPDGSVLMSQPTFRMERRPFSKPDLMDYGSIYGMGSYFGEDYTAEYLARLGTVTADNGPAVSALDPERQAAAQSTMQHALQGIDLTRSEVTFPEPVEAAVAALKTEIAELSDQPQVTG